MSGFRSSALGSPLVEGVFRHATAAFSAPAAAPAGSDPDSAPARRRFVSPGTKPCIPSPPARRMAPAVSSAGIDKENPVQGITVLNPDELGQDPAVGMDLALGLGVGHLEIRTAYGSNALVLSDAQLREVRRLADERGLRVAALASPLWKWCRPEAVPGKVDSFGFPTQVPAEDRQRWVDRALAVADILGTDRVRVFSHLAVGEQTEEFRDDPLLTYALKAAERAGVRLLLENEPVCTVAEPAPLLDVLREHTGLGLWLDLGNLYEVGHGTAETVGALAPYVGYVHIKDYVPRDDGMKQFVAAGAGDVPYAVLLPALHRVRPVLPYALETHVRETPGEALTRGAAFLRGAIPGGLA